MKQCRWFLTVLVLITAANAFAVARGQRWEQTITTNAAFTWTTAKLCVQYTSPSSKVFTGTGYWDNRVGGVDQFKLRAAFNETGTWGWTLLYDAGCIQAFNITGTTNGSISVTGDLTGNPIYANGPVRVDGSGRFLVYSGNAVPFHWIGDTSWGGPHRSTSAAWSTYLTNRQTKGFSVTQVAVPTGQNTGGTNPLVDADNGATPFLGAGCTTAPLPRAACLPNPLFWQQWDAHIADINAKQMLASIIGLYKRTDEAGSWPTVADSQGYARFIAARVAGNYTTLAPGFDEVPNAAVGDYTTGCANANPNQACRAREIGTAIKQAILLQTTINASPRTGTPLSALVTHHIGGGCPGGGDGTNSCVVDQWLSSFENESWLDFNLVQSGQGLNCDSAQEVCIARRSSTRMLRLYNIGPVKPVINGEAIYDNAGSPNANYGEMRGRQTAFNTLLSGGAGFTHGVGGTWDWGGYFTGRTVAQSQAAPSATQIGKIKIAFSTIPWQRLVPDCQSWGALCTDIKNNEQTGSAAHLKRMYASDSSGQFAIAYLPEGVADSSLKLNLDNLPGFTNAAGTTWRTQWYNPRAGCTCSANAINSGGTTWSFNRPSNTVDWALFIRNSSSISALGVGACAAIDCP